MISTASLDPSTTALLMIDVQEEYFAPDGLMALPDGTPALQRAATLLQRARRAGVAVFHVQHVSEHPMAREFRPGTPGVELRPEVAPRDDETVTQKRTPSAFVGTRLEEELRERDVSTVVIAGFMTGTCCMATAHEALGRRYRTVVSSDATAAQGYGPEGHEMVHARALDTLRRLGAEVLSTASIAGLMSEVPATH